MFHKLSEVKRSGSLFFLIVFLVPEAFEADRSAAVKEGDTGFAGSPTQCDSGFKNYICGKMIEGHGP